MTSKFDSRAYIHGRIYRYFNTNIPFEYVDTVYINDDKNKFIKEAKKQKLKYRIITKLDIDGNDYELYLEVKKNGR